MLNTLWDRKRALPGLSRSALLATLAVFAVPAAHSQDFRGSLIGTVDDSTGSSIPGARVSIRLQSPLVERDAATGQEGDFRFDKLQPGKYSVVVKAAGFDDATADVDVVVSSVRAIHVTLKPAALRSAVLVQGQSSSITT